MKSIRSYFTKKSIKANGFVEENEELIDNGIKYLLNNKDMTASVLNGSKAKGNIYIPRTVKNKNKEYLVTNILKQAFYCSKIKRVNFALDSELKLIESDSFTNSSIECISVPAHVIKIGEKAFYNCRKFNSIQFQLNSELKTIETGAFASTCIQSIEIPSSVVKINDVAFCNSYLNNIIIQKDSKLEFIGEQVFSCTKITKFFIPEHLKEIGFGSFASVNLINVNISPNNKHFVKLLNDKILAYKSDINNSIFDVIIWGSRKLIEIMIPSFIKKIDAFAFSNCNDLKKIQFAENSELKSIGDSAFSSCSMSSISIPKNVTEIGHEAFCYCEFLKIVEFPENSKIQSLHCDVFNSTYIEIIMVPSNVVLFIDDKSILFDNG